MKSLLKLMIRHFFIIYTGSMFGTLIYCFFFSRDSLFGIDYFVQMFFFSLLGDLPLLIFYSKKELTKSQMAKRVAVHFFVLEFLLLAAGYYLQLYKLHFLEMTVFFLIIALVYILVVVFGIIMDSFTADEINKFIEEKKRGK